MDTFLKIWLRAPTTCAVSLKSYEESPVVSHGGQQGCEEACEPCYTWSLMCTGPRVILVSALMQLITETCLEVCEQRFAFQHC